MGQDPFRPFVGHFDFPAGLDPRPATSVGQAQANPYETASVAGPTTGVSSKPPPDPVDRGAAALLTDAAAIVEGARNVSHGAKERSFVTIAELWSAYLGRTVTAADVALMMVLLKVGRTVHGTPVRDHFLDMAGYAAIAGELSALDKPLQ